MFYYCDNCRKIKSWARTVIRHNAQCDICGISGGMNGIPQTPVDIIIDRCPDPCQGVCSLCPLVKDENLPESDTQGLDNILRDQAAKKTKVIITKPELGSKSLGDIIKECNDRNGRKKGETRVDVDGGKYTVVMPDTGGLHALRHGEPWRELVGDNLIWCLAAELRDAREEINMDKRRLQSMIRLANGQEERIKKLEEEMFDDSIPF